MDIFTFCLFLILAIIPILCRDLSLDFFVTFNSPVTYDVSSLSQWVKDDLKEITATLIDDRDFRTKIGTYVVNDHTWNETKDVGITISNRALNIATVSDTEATYEVQLISQTYKVELKYVRLTAIYDTRLCCNGTKSEKWSTLTVFDRKLPPTLTNCNAHDDNDDCHADFVFGYLDDKRTICTPLNVPVNYCISSGDEGVEQQPDGQNATEKSGQTSGSSGLHVMPFVLTGYNFLLYVNIRNLSKSSLCFTVIVLISVVMVGVHSEAGQAYSSGTLFESK